MSILSCLCKDIADKGYESIYYGKGEGIMKRIMILVLMAAFFGMFLIPDRAAAWNEAQLQQLKTTNKCPSCDLSNANLSGANLTGARWTDGPVCQSGSIGECKK